MKRPEPKTSPRKVRAAQKAAAALELRAREGRAVTYDQIAEKCGYKGRGSAYRAVRAELAKLLQTSKEHAEAILQSELAELDDLADAVRAAALEPNAKGKVDLYAHEQLRKTIADRRKLLGADAPTKVQDVTPPRDEQWAMVRRWLTEPTEELVLVLHECGWRRDEALELPEKES